MDASAWVGASQLRSGSFSGEPMQSIAFEICERVAEAQALIHDHMECGKHTAEEVVARLRALFEERALLQAMYDVGYFPQNTPLAKRIAALQRCTLAIPRDDSRRRMRYATIARGEAPESARWL